jgi:hypothetical protein
MARTNHFFDRYELGVSLELRLNANVAREGQTHLSCRLDASCTRAPLPMGAPIKPGVTDRRLFSSAEPMHIMPKPAAPHAGIRRPRESARAARRRACVIA